MSELQEIFNIAVDRLAAGESIAAIVREYPQQADDLRELLMLGQMAGQSQIHADELNAAHDSGHARLVDLIYAKEEKRNMNADKPKRKVRPVTKSRWRLPAAAAAALVLVVAGVLIGMFAANRQTVPVTIQPPLAVADACTSLTQPSYGQSQQDQAQNQTVQPTVVPRASATAAPTLPLVSESTAPPPSDPDISLDKEEDRVDESGAGVGGEFGYSDDSIAGAPATGGSGSDTAIVVPEGVSVVPTSVASFDERSRDVGEAAAEPPAPGESFERTGTLADADGDDLIIGGRTETESRPVVANVQPLQPLRAGEIDDNADWDTYMEYRRNYFEQYSPFSVNDVDVSDREIIRVVDENGLPVLGACVQIYNGESLIVQTRTFATGMTLFFPNMLERTRYVDTFRVVAHKDGEMQEAILDREAVGDVLTIELPIAQQVQSQLDVMFLIDATGSMSDEIQQLQDNILSISAQIDALPGNVDVRYGLVAYRDFGDAYVTQVNPFVSDVQSFQQTLRQLQAGGGGDYPEALNEGLNDALNNVQWRGENTVKLVFLVADAPPHIDYDNGLDYSLLMLDSMARGIKVHPIASSGLQPDGEYILRQIGQVTMGHFVFLTYDGGTPGTPGDDRPDLDVGTPEDEQGIGDYSVAQLDELVLRLITDELAALRGQ